MLLQAVPHPDNYSHTISKHLEANTGYKIWRSFWHILWHSFRHSIWHLFWHTFWIFLPYKLNWHSILAFYLAFILTFFLFPLRSGARGWCPAVPTEQIWSSPLRSGSAHWDGARSWGPAVPTDIWSWRMRSGSAQHLELADEARQCPLRSRVRCW